MRIRNVVVCVVAAMPLLAVGPASAPLNLQLHVDAALRTNAVYHLACLAGSISCSNEIFERFWKDRPAAVHEIAHYLYDYIPPDKHLALANEFIASGAPSIAGIYSYLHEAMAVSAPDLYGDALDNNTSDSADSGDAEYRHPYIPALARVAAPLVQAAVARHEQLVGGFSKAYIAGVLSTLGSRRNELPFVFAQAVLVTTSGNRAFADAFQRTLFPVGTVRFTELAKAAAFPDPNLVQFSAYPELGAITDRQLVPLREAHRGFAFASSRGRGGYHLIVAGRSGEDILAVIEQLGDVDNLIGPGLVVSVD